MKAEATRNQVLRRADWRFLLPDPWPQSAVYLGRDAHLGAAVREVASAPSSGAASADLVVVHDPTPAKLRAAWRSLRPGGTCYSEWHWPLMGGAQAVRRRLESVGFVGVTAYWAWPWRAPAQFWLPVEAPGPVEYFTRSKTSARRALWRATARAGLLGPLRAIAHKPPHDATQLYDRIRSSWPEFHLQSSQHGPRLLLLTGGQRSINKVVALVSAGPDDTPHMVVKFPRVPESVPALAREAEVLRHIERTLPRVREIPRCIWFDQDTGALAETIVAGRPLYEHLNSATYRRLALAVTSWVADLAGGARRSAPPPTEPILSEFARCYGKTVPAAALAHARRYLSNLPPLPTAVEHRDLSPWNILIDADDKLAILDWESAELEGMAGADLVYFLTYLAFFVDGAMDSGTYRQSYRKLLNPATPTGAVTEECLRLYATRTGMDPSALRGVRLLTWMVHARSEHERLSADAGARPDAAALENALFKSLWEEELNQCNDY